MKRRIGIVGGGQLGRMLTIPAKKLGFTVNIIDPTPNSPAGQIADHQIVADYKDENAIRKLASMSDYMTFEIELANSDILGELKQKGLKINPSPETLGIIRDKLAQKIFLKKNGLPVADFAKVSSEIDALMIAERFDYPFLLKTRFDAYDGRGNALVEKENQIKLCFDKLKNKRLYAEKYVPFIKELAIMVARNTNGEIATYPVVETIHKNNILHMLYAPANVSEDIKIKAKDIATKTMVHLEGAGIFGIEMFLTKNGEILINEIAPRVHNSGHYTIEACRTSQFEQHIKAITGMPLGATDMTVPHAVMVNILGERSGIADPKGVEKAEKISGVKVHIYGKLETKPERKMGHITAIGKDLNEAYNRAIRAKSLISI